MKHRERLNGVHSELVRLVSRVDEVMPIFVLEGYRGKQRQNKLFEEGKSKVKYPNSKHNHNPALAVDIAPYPIDWNDTKKFHFLAGIVFGLAHELGIKIRWGGDWDMDLDFNDQKFYDLVHFELVENIGKE